MSAVPIHVQIPTHGNPPKGKKQGKKFGPAHHDVFKAKLIELFGGFSLMPGTIAGSWADGGEVYKDTTMVFVVDVPGIIKSREQVWEMVAFAKEHYDQLAIRVTYLSVSEVL